MHSAPVAFFYQTAIILQDAATHLMMPIHEGCINQPPLLILLLQGTDFLPGEMQIWWHLSAEQAPRSAAILVKKHLLHLHGKEAQLYTACNNLCIWKIQILHPAAGDVDMLEPHRRLSDLLHQQPLCGTQKPAV